MTQLYRFLKSESGAVTVDWVVLTAAVVGLALVALLPIFTGTTDISKIVSSSVTATKVGP